MSERVETPAWRALWTTCYSHHVACCTSATCDHMAKSEERTDELYRRIVAEAPDCAYDCSVCHAHEEEDE